MNCYKHKESDDADLQSRFFLAKNKEVRSWQAIITRKRTTRQPSKTRRTLQRRSS
nr:MAG TPA: hypothetical protein [Myoviridae sp. ctTfa5]